MSADGTSSPREHPADVAVWLGGRIASARALLDRLADSQRFHARLLGHELGHQHDVGSRSIRELIAEPARGRRAAIRDVVRRHLVAAEADGRIVVTIGNLLAAEHAAASRTCDEIAAATAGFEDDDLRAVTPLLRNAVSLLARALLDTLELRVLAETLDDSDRAALLARERDRWAALAARVSVASLTGALELEAGPGASVDGAQDDVVPPRGPAAALRPLAGRVVLALAEGPVARARVAAVIEQAGASAVIVHTRAAALELLRWFRVDAVVTAIEGRSDTLLHLPHALDHASARRPPCIALLLPAAAAAASAAESFGYDAAIPLAAADTGAVVEMLGAALEVRVLAARA